MVMKRLPGITPSFVICFAPSKCKTMLPYIQNLSAPLTIHCEALEIFDNFTYIGICIGISSAPSTVCGRKSMHESRRLKWSFCICVIYGARNELVSVIVAKHYLLELRI